MNPTPCLDPETLDAVLDAPEIDPRRRHARECPRCGALLESYRLFRESPEDAPPSDLAEAEARLSAALQREMGPAPASSARIAPRGAPHRRGPLGSWFVAWRPAFAFAAVAVVAGAVVLWSRFSPEPETVTLRGGPDSTETRLAIGEARLAGGTVTMSWSGLPGVTRYEIRFYTPDLVERGVVTAADTSWSRSLDQLGFPVDTTQAVLVRVYAIDDDGLESHSVARPLARR